MRPYIQHQPCQLAHLWQEQSLRRIPRHWQGQPLTGMRISQAWRHQFGTLDPRLQMAIKVLKIGANAVPALNGIDNTDDSQLIISHATSMKSGY